MSYPCLGCSLRFTSFSDAEDHHRETGHEIGAWRTDPEDYENG